MLAGLITVGFWKYQDTDEPRKSKLNGALGMKIRS